MNKETYLTEYPKHESMRENVKKDKNRLHFHMMPPTGWMNDPNGLCEFQGVNHIYFQYTPFLAGWGTKLWGHYTTKDWIHYKEEEPFLYPDEEWDRDGVYSGSAYTCEDGIHYFYTGNVKLWDKDYDYIMNGREQNTIHVFSPDGKNIAYKKLVMTNDDYPVNMSKHVRDPKIYKKDGRYYMIQGGRDAESYGCALLFCSDDLEHWKWYDTVRTAKPFGYMWECPDLFELDGQLCLICCPQGVEKKGYDYWNVHQCVCIPLDYDFTPGTWVIKTTDNFQMVDRGFDFYAPQTFEDQQGRRILIGWMGIPDADYTNPTVKKGWQHALTIPRQLHIRDGKLYQEPVKELEKLCRNGRTFSKEEFQNLELPKCAKVQIDFKDCKNMEFSISDGVKLTYMDHVLTLDLGNCGSGRTIRKVWIEELTDLTLFADTTSLELFINKGSQVFTTRVYGKQGKAGLKGQCDARIQVYEMSGYEYGRI